MKFIILALLAASTSVNAQVAPLASEIKIVPAIKKIAIVNNKHYTIRKNEQNKFVFIPIPEEGQGTIVKPQIITIIPAK